MTRIPLLTLNVAGEDDVVAARQQARIAARALGFETQDQARIATAVAELARDIQPQAGDSRVVFELESGDGGGSSVTVHLIDRQLAASAIDVARPAAAVDEPQDQNRELAAALDEIERQGAELDRLTSELDETNRGVLALYRELDDRAEDLRRASESKSRFLSMISHELRTPLTSVLNLSRLLLDRVDGELTPEQEHQLVLIRGSIQSLIDMVNDLLDLARIEAGKTNVTVAPVQVGEILSGLRGVFRPVLQSSVVALVLEDPPEPVELCTDEGKVAQVLRNFISNAVKFTEEGEIRVTVARDLDGVTFSVSDTGIGIPREHHERIFEDFTQVENPRQRYVHGTGLGLPLSRKIAALLGGSVGLESELGEGSRFWIRLPLMHPLADPSCMPQRLDLTVDLVAEVIRG